MNAVQKPFVIFDPLYGFIHLTPVERDILHSVFYQRLRWIRQLGFSSYLFPGAEHSRFGHSIGVMHNAHLILSSIGKSASDHALLDPKNTSSEKMFNQEVRLGGLMHDLGTFCFSHTTEEAYVNFAETKKLKGKGGFRDDHENLGPFIIENTDYPGGVTHILKNYGYEPKRISNLVKGMSSSLMANQILHSEIDCDRMDYLLRDAHYTGLKYGSYDRDYLLYHFRASQVDGKEILSIKENALPCIEDFLGARFTWYSQVIRSPRGAKYDAIARHLCLYFLKKGWIYRYSELLEMISNNPAKFWKFNDGYFMGLVHKYHSNGSLDKTPDIKDMAETLLFSKLARHLRCKELDQRLLDQDNPSENQRIFQEIKEKVKEIKEVVKKKGDPSNWVLEDIPERDITFVSSHKTILDKKGSINSLHTRDPVKISYENGEIKLLTEVRNSAISKLSKINNFIPNVFVNQSTYDLLVREKLTEDVRPSEQFS